MAGLGLGTTTSLLQQPEYILAQYINGKTPGKFKRNVSLCCNFMSI